MQSDQIPVADVAVYDFSIVVFLLQLDIKLDSDHQLLHYSNINYTSVLM